MQSLTLQEIKKWTEGKSLTHITKDAPVAQAVCSDSRHLSSGCLFIAIKGERYNAHKYLSEAASKGAIAALVEEPPAEPLSNVHLIQVQNTRKAMGKLARYVRGKLRATVIAVGGSNGKTTTKFLIDAALNGTKKGSMSPKSFNNDIGVPLTIFAADPSQDYLVLEIGTNHPGEVQALTQIAAPDIAVITNIGAEHLEGFGDLMGVRNEEASIITGLNPQGLLVVNGDDAQLLEAVAPYPGKHITFGFDESNDLFPTDIRCDSHGTRFCLNGSNNREVFVPMLGRHSACNALAAIAVARRLGLQEEQIVDALALAQGPDMRLQMTEACGVSILNDAYNANPHSMKAALDTLETLAGSGRRRVAVLGDMLELGESTARYHRELGQYAAGKHIDELVCVGERSLQTAEAARAAGLDADRIMHCVDAASAAAVVPDMLQPGDLVLIKASRGIQLEAVAAAIMAKRVQPLRAAS